MLAARGFAVLAFDKRGSGESNGDWRGASFQEVADDAVAGAKFLATRSEVDASRIGFWGLSQGAWIAPLAAVRFQKARFVMTLSGGGLTPEDGELFDSEHEMGKAGYPDEATREALAFQKAKNSFWRTGAGWEDYLARRQQARAKPWYALAGTDISGPDTRDDAYWARDRRFYFYDPAPTLSQLRAPLLAIFGEFDSPEGVKANVAGLTKALSTGGRRNFTIKVFPNGRHNLMDLEGFAPNEYAKLQRFVPGLFETMVSWIQQKVTR